MVYLLLDEQGLQGIQLSDNLTAERLLSHKELLDRIAPSLQKLDAEIRQGDEKTLPDVAVKE